MRNPILAPGPRAVAALAMLAASYVACGPVRIDDGSEFDVLIFVLDACRPDRMGAYGYSLPTTPAIDSLAADPDAVIFDRHYVEGNWTKPSTASLFSGLYQHQHGVTKGHAKVGQDVFETQVLNDELVTLAEEFRDAGYATFGVVKSHHLVPAYGFAQGFDHYSGPGDVKGDAGRVAKVAEVIANLDRGYFGYVHLNACHHPFPRNERDPEFMARHGFEYDEAARAAVGVDFTTQEILDAIRNDRLELTAADRRYLSLIYDASLRRVDRRTVAPMLEGLRRSGRWDRTLLILTADHGEELVEHGGYAHSHALWDEIIRVPMIVKFPKGLRPQALPDRVDAPTSNVDVFPTLMEFLGRPVPRGLAGRPIFRAPEGGFILSQDNKRTWAVVLGHEKLLVDRDGRKRLFDLDADPGETVDVADERPARVAALTAIGESARSLDPVALAPEIQTELSPEAIESLRSLGYLD